jgi:hypothetical protein
MFISRQETPMCAAPLPRCQWQIWCRTKYLWARNNQSVVWNYLDEGSAEDSTTGATGESDEKSSSDGTWW